MHFLSTRVHGTLDYLVAAILLAAPWIVGFAAGGAETLIPVAVGLGIIGYSLCTDYELGVLRRMQMPVHLWIDAATGLFLMISPWLFSFDDEVWIPHLVVGSAMLAIAFFTNTIPGYERRGSRGDQG